MNIRQKMIKRTFRYMKRWNLQEIDFLKDNYKSKSYGEISEMLSRPIRGVRAKAEEISLRKNRAWKYDEFDFLRKNFLIMGNQEISKIISRSNISVMSALRKYNFKRNPPTLKSMRGRVWDCRAQSLKIKEKYLRGELSRNIGATGKNNPMFGKRHSKEIIEGIKKKISGKLSPHWLGGKSFEPYGLDFNNKLKGLIRRRDNQICMLCRTHREKLNRALDVHHINYDKRCNLIQNLVALCINCHTPTNYNREHWQKFFQSLLSEKYGYKYSENKEIILEVKNGI